MIPSACQKCAENVGKVNVVGNILMIAIKGYLGIVGRSRGLIADAIHSSADLLATIIMIVGLKVSDRESDETHPYGYGKVEYLVAVIIYVCLFAVGIYIVFEGIITILHHRRSCPNMAAAWGAVFSIAINELLFRQSVCAGTHISSPSMVAKAWESRSDVYSSVAVLIGILGTKLGFWFMDPLAAVIVGGIILKISVEMVTESIENLMDHASQGQEVDKVTQMLEKQEGIYSVEKITARDIGQLIEVDLKLRVHESLKIREGEALIRHIRKRVTRLIKRETRVRVMLLPAQERCHETS